MNGEARSVLLDEDPEELDDWYFHGIGWGPDDERNRLYYNPETNEAAWHPDDPAAEWERQDREETEE